MSLCPVDACSRPRHHDWTICTQHSWQLERDLAEIPALADELDTTLARQVGNGPGNGSRSADKPLPYDLAASTAGWLLRNTLVGWIRDLEPDITHHPADTIAAMGRWLYARHHLLVVHPAAEQCVEELAAARHEATKAVQPDRRGRISIPEACPEPGCSAALWASMHDVGDPRPNLVWCDGDEKHEWRPEQWLRLGHRLGYGRTA